MIKKLVKHKENFDYKKRGKNNYFFSYFTYIIIWEMFSCYSGIQKNLKLFNMQLNDNSLKYTKENKADLT